MNILKILSLLLFAIFCFAICIVIAVKILKKKDENILLNNQFIKLSSIFIAVSTVLNLVFQKVSYLYDVIGQYSINVDFIKLFPIGKYNYGYSPEMIKVCCIYLAISFVWIFIASLFSKMISKYFFEKSTLNFYLFEGITLICISIAFYPILNFILENFYIVLDQPTIN